MEIVEQNLAVKKPKGNRHLHQFDNTYAAFRKHACSMCASCALHMHHLICRSRQVQRKSLERFSEK